MGGSSGGGSSGEVDFPDYMKAKHEDWLNDISGVINASIASNPYSGYSAYDPTTSLNTMSSSLALFTSVVTALAPDTAFTARYGVVSPLIDEIDSSIEMNVASQVASHAAILEADLDATVLPAYKRALQNVGASMSSAFVIGEAIIRARRDKELDRFQSDVELKNADLRVEKNKLKVGREAVVMQGVQILKSDHDSRLEAFKIYVHQAVEVERLKIVANKEQRETDLEFDVKGGRWALDSYDAGCRVMASISGAATSKGVDGPSKVQSALGGAMGGAAMGGALGGPMGAVAGGLLGGVAGLF